MKPLILAMTCLLAAGIATGADAREKRHRGHEPAHRAEGYYTRPSTVDRRGLCQRDTGRPLDQLNLNQRCDREEFWERIRDRGGDGRN